jgi:hypothetical protein
MAESGLAKYIRKGISDVPSRHSEITVPSLKTQGGGGFGSVDFSMNWSAITQPFQMVPEPHTHDFEQFLIFAGNGPNMVDLGGEVELTLGEDKENLETFVFTEATSVFIAKGLYHGPLTFRKVNDPAKPILFIDMFFSPEYIRNT